MIGHVFVHNGRLENLRCCSKSLLTRPKQILTFDALALMYANVRKEANNLKSAHRCKPCDVLTLTR